MGSVIGNVAGGIVGGLFGDKGGGQSQTQTREPWKPAQPFLEGAIKDATDLNKYYQQNPFNQLQQNAYQNLFGDIDAFRSSMAPGLMNVANGLMGSNYQRAPAGSELGASNPYRPGGQSAGIQGLLSGYAPQGQPSQGQATPQGLLGAMQGASGQRPPAGPESFGGLLEGGGGSGGGGAPDSFQGLMGNPMTFQAKPAPAQQQQGGMTMNSGPFSVPQGTPYGQIDFNALNPFTNGGIKPPEQPAVPDQKTVNDMVEEWMRINDPSFLQRREISRAGDGGA